MKDILDGFRGADGIDKHNLLKGILYPDLPCGRFEFQGPKVVMTKKSLCDPKHAKSLLDPNYFNPVFQSHRGVYAFLHSMTWKQGLKVKDVRDHIIRYVMNFALLSLYDDHIQKKPLGKSVLQPNEFWIGIVLHIMMDSYSKAHTIRLDMPTEMPKRPPPLPYQQFKDDMKRLLVGLRANIWTKEELKEVLFKTFNKEGEREYISKKIKTIFTLYKMYMFDKAVGAISKKYYKKTRKDLKTGEKYDIQNFQFYNNQSFSYHKKYDFINYVRKYPGLYERMIKECRHVLRLWQKASKGQMETREFMKEMYDYLISNTFRVSTAHLKDKTGVVYA